MIDNNATKLRGSILVFGAGSIGSVLGVLLSHHGWDVELFRRSVQNQQDTIRLVGVQDTSAGLSLHALSTPQSQKLQPDIIFITVQAQQTSRALNDLLSKVNINETTIVVSLQNGLTAPSIIDASLKPILGRSPLLIQGVVWWSATQITDSLVLYHNKAPTVLGIPEVSSAKTNHLTQIQNLLETVLSVSSTDNIAIEARKKLVLNVVSPVLALLKLPYPSGLHNPIARNLIHLLFDEVLAIGRQKGWDLDDDRLVNFHKILAGLLPPPSPPPYKIDDALSFQEIVHKVSTQISAEKHGGNASNAHELLSYFIENGAELCEQILKEVQQLPPQYEALSESRLEAIISRNSEKSCSFVNE
ncbi:MAG: 2-dehydropantoate 2-reductase N-terminal domain-containing protein [Candidatus Kariarchaeaceae archaeon]|jgi:2-dehydropantoate 2-reductase